MILFLLQISLGLENARKHESSWDEMYNLMEQSTIRQDCQKLVGELPSKIYSQYPVFTFENVDTFISRILSQFYEVWRRIPRVR